MQIYSYPPLVAWKIFERLCGFALIVHGEMVWSGQTAGAVWEGTVHGNQFHSDNRQHHSSGQLWSIVSPVCSFSVQMQSQRWWYDICIHSIFHSLMWTIFGIKQQRSDEENWRDWSHRRYEESCQAGYKLLLRWVIKLMESLWLILFHNV